MDELDGRQALVLGGSRGIGAGIVRALAAAGAQVTFTYLSAADEAEALAREVGATAVRADSTDRRAVADLVAGLERLDVLVVSSGATVMGDPLDLDPGAVDAMFDLNVRAPYFACVEAARRMGDGGRIVLVGSTMADAMPFAGGAAYAATKAALHGMARGFARDLGGRGITVNVVQPGPTDTDANPADGPGADHVRSLLPTGRYVQPDEVGALVRFLASPSARSITGSAHRVDAGFGA